ncbi:alpha/beta hydrolase [Bifidobacterium platyrrhinorum]|uniref:Esterase n=1 Tax=Bifidobacterium platyrrhinorum TaxID=2661628 RepID=A0A6L9SSU9_9BIFI|nr:alpha/beta hydrolase-fold protein [Bifidobacterium platyrrhinorum]NEG55660.1 esterase [Bifidobacterium platyrrhinorum]
MTIDLTIARYSRGGGATHPTHPLFLCLHGWGSNEAEMADLMRQIAPYNDFASLRGPLRLAGGDAYSPGAYAWFGERVPFGEDLDRAAYEMAVSIDRWVANNLPDEREVVPLGFSQGGLLAVHLLRVNPKRYRAAVSLSGYIAPGVVPGTAPADGILERYNVPVFYTYGKNDDVVPKYELFAAQAWLNEHTWLTTKSYRALDHNVSLEELADLRQWFLDHDITSGVL